MYQLCSVGKTTLSQWTIAILSKFGSKIITDAIKLLMILILVCSQGHLLTIQCVSVLAACAGYWTFWLCKYFLSYSFFMLLVTNWCCSWKMSCVGSPALCLSLQHLIPVAGCSSLAAVGLLGDREYRRHQLIQRPKTFINNQWC